MGQFPAWVLSPLSSSQGQVLESRESLTGFPGWTHCRHLLPSGAVEIFCLAAYTGGLRSETAWVVTSEDGVPGESHSL